MSKRKELQEELRAVLSGRGARWIDSFLPPLVFLIASPLAGASSALWAALLTAGAVAVIRILKKESLVYAAGGVGGTILAAVFVKISGSGAGFFLPGMFSGALTILLCVVSVAFNRPMVAWTSFIARRWPLGWYWHPRVMPAYSEVTILWAVAFSARLALEYRLYQQNAVNELGAVRLFLGWPFIILLLIASYLYGLWRLDRLKGPSVEEYRANTPPPWKGQKKGF